MVDGLDQSLEVFIFNDVIRPPLLGAPLEERAELFDAGLIDVDANNVVAAMGEERVAGMTAVVLLFVVVVAARST
jgi:hypothetical protein